MASVISYGGGVQSTALVVLSLLEGWDVDDVVHVDLMDAESPATREYVARFRDWLRQEHGRDITIIERNMYRDMLDNPGFTPVPWRARDGSFMLSRQCTRQYKVAPLQRYLYDRYPGDCIRLMLGISVDEFHRMRDSSAARIEHVYPLVDARLTRWQCREIIERAGLAVPSKSSCWFCPYRSSASQLALVRHYPRLREMARALEDRINADRRRRGRDEVVVLRVDMSAEQGDFCEAGFCDV
jgi:PP-loop superfamily ATP-utilizing enzyme